MKKLFHFLLLFTLGCQLQSQVLYSPQCDIEFGNSELTSEHISDTYKASLIELSEEDINKIAKEVRASNKSLESVLDSVNQNITDIYIDKIRATTIGELSEFKYQILELRDKLEESKKRVQESLSQVKFPGIYLVILDIGNIKESRVEDLAKSARIAIEPIALENLIGTQIERITEVKNGVLREDLIKAVTGGEFDVEHVIFDKAIYDKRKYIFLTRINVKPGVIAETRNDYNDVAAKVYDLHVEHSYIEALETVGLTEAEVILVQEKVKDFDITSSLNISTFLYDEILTSGEQEFAEIKREILDLENRLKEKILDLSRLCEKYGVPVRNEDLDATLKSLKSQIHLRLIDLKAVWINEKSRELIYVGDFTEIGSSPAKTFTNQVEDMVMLIKNNYSTIHTPFEVIEIRNSIVENFQKSRGITSYREIDRVWCYSTFIGSKIRTAVVVQMKMENEILPVHGEDFIGLNNDTPEPKTRLIPGGKFRPGVLADNSSNKPLVEVSPFRIGIYEVTQKEWEAIMESNPSENKCSYCPIENVSYEDVMYYIQELNKRTGKRYRLPTENEWEYAARGGGEDYLFGDGTSDPNPERLNFDSNIDRSGYSFVRQPSKSKTVEVGSLDASNKHGLHDMSGNVFEWTSSNESYGKKIIRGGSWYHTVDLSTTIYRTFYGIKAKSPYLGFRIALDSSYP